MTISNPVKPSPTPLKKIGIDTTAIAETLLFTTATGRGRFITKNIYVVNVTQTGTLTTNAAFSVGTNNPDYNDLYGIVMPAFVDATTNEVYDRNQDGFVNPRLSIPEGTGVYLLITTFATGTDLVQLLDVYVDGFYENDAITA